MIRGYYPIGLKQFLSALIHINKHFRVLFDRAQGVQRKIVSTVPTTDTLGESEEVYYVSGSTYRKYVKINGVIKYWSLS